MSIFAKMSKAAAFTNDIKALSVGAVVAVGMLSLPASAAPSADVYPPGVVQPQAPSGGGYIVRHPNFPPPDSVTRSHVWGY